jgi:predicted glycosyltransferase
MGRRFGNGDGIQARRRVLIYSHDTYGLGHLRRSMLIAGGLAALPEAPSVLIATGSPRTQSFSLPQGCDSVKLPAVTKTSRGDYRPRSLNMTLAQLVRLRSEILRGAARAFDPDVVLVDHAPIGMEGELLPLFADIETWPRRPRVALGLREIVDDAARIGQDWERSGVWDALRTVYDRILVYGDPRIRTTAQDLGLSERLPGKVAFTGYLGRAIRPLGDGRPDGTGGQGRPAASGEATLPLILVTTGGGGDGQEVLRAYAATLAAAPRPHAFRSVVVTGPFLSRRRQRDIAARYRDLDAPVELLTFTDRMEDLLGQAAGVISMAGYNSVVEILSAGVPALLVPRERPRLEQTIRAQRLAGIGGIRVAGEGSELPAEMAEFVERVLDGSPRARPMIRLDGVRRAALELRSLMTDRWTGHDRTKGAGAHVLVTA